MLIPHVGTAATQETIQQICPLAMTRYCSAVILLCTSSALLSYFLIAFKSECDKTCHFVSIEAKLLEALRPTGH